MALDDQQRRRIHGAALGAVAGLLAVLLGLTATFEALETGSADARMRFWRFDRPAHPDLVTVLIDDAALEVLEPRYGRWPWNRAAHADLLAALRKAGARAAIFDVLFSERDLRDAAGDRRLADEAAAFGRAYLALVLRRDGDVPVALPDSVRARLGIGAQGLPTGPWNGAAVPYAELAAAARGFGAINVSPDRDGAIRRVALLHEFQGAAVPALSLTALPEALDNPVVEASAGVLRLGDRRFPLDASGRHAILYHGRYVTVGFADVLGAAGLLPPDTRGVRPLELSALRDKIVFIGPSAAGLGDIKLAPLDTAMPGVFAHVSTASNLLQGESLAIRGGFARAVITLLLAALTGALLLGVRAPFGALAALAPIAAYVAFAWWRFGANAHWPLVAPATAALLAYVAGLLRGYLAAAPAARVDAPKPAAAREGAVAVVYADFAPLCATDAAAQRRFAGLPDWEATVRGHQGRVLRRDGEGLLAVWTGPEAVRRAFSGAEALSVALARAVATQGQAGRARPPTGVGLAAGDGMIDGGLLAAPATARAMQLARLAGRLGCGLVLDEIAAGALGASAACAPVDRVRFCAGAEGVTLYRPLLDGAARDLRDRWEAAFADYREGRWDAALAGLAELPQDRVARRLARRCERLRAADPAGWDGCVPLDAEWQPEQDDEGGS